MLDVDIEVCRRQILSGSPSMIQKRGDFGLENKNEPFFKNLKLIINTYASINGNFYWSILKN